jgi:N-acetylmuramoyl-L-alanine amidase
MIEDQQILARTIYGEARGEYYKSVGGIAALIAIGNVVINRLNQKTWYGRSVREVCQKPNQFSCWNANDPNYPLILQDLTHDPCYQVCEEVASKVMCEVWPDLTCGCDHYYAITLPVAPKWAQGREAKVRIANHVFFDLRQLR